MKFVRLSRRSDSSHALVNGAAVTHNWPTAEGRNCQTLVNDAAVTHNDVYEEFDVFLRHVPFFLHVYKWNFYYSFERRT